MVDGGRGWGDWKLDTATRNTVQLKLTQMGLANRIVFILNTLDIAYILKPFAITHASCRQNERVLLCKKL